MGPPCTFKVFAYGKSRKFKSGEPSIVAETSDRLDCLRSPHVLPSTLFTVRWLDLQACSLLSSACAAYAMGPVQRATWSPYDNNGGKHGPVERASAKRVGLLGLRESPCCRAYARCAHSCRAHRHLRGRRRGELLHRGGRYANEHGLQHPDTRLQEDCGTVRPRTPRHLARQMRTAHGQQAATPELRVRP